MSKIISCKFLRIYLKIAEVEGQIGTMKWQLGVLLALGLGGSGSLLVFLIKKHFDEREGKFPRFLFAIKFIVCIDRERS